VLVEEVGSGESSLLVSNKKMEKDVRNLVDAYTLVSTNSRLTVTQAQNESDIKETVQIGRQHFGGYTYPLEMRIRWFGISPKGDYVLKRDGAIIGYFSMQAMRKEAIKRIFTYKDSSVQIEDMVPLVPGELLECYISAIAVNTVGLDRIRSRIYGMLLLMGVSDRLVDLGKEGIHIHKIWAKSRTVSGIRLSRDLGFEELGYIDNEQVGFVLDLERSDLPTIKKYKEALGKSRRGVEGIATQSQNSTQAGFTAMQPVEGIATS
jgi:hypothetical protein